MLTKLIAANFYRKYVQRSCSSVSKSAETQDEIAASAARALQLKTLFGMEFAFLFSLLAGMRFFRNPRLEEEERKLREAECVAVVGKALFFSFDSRMLVPSVEFEINCLLL